MSREAMALLVGSRVISVHHSTGELEEITLKVEQGIPGQLYTTAAIISIAPGIKGLDIRVKEAETWRR